MKLFDNVVFIDNHLLVANKPAGWLTQPNGTPALDLETQLKNWIKKKFQKSGNVFLHAVHRLDRPVSGLVLFARSSKGLTRLNAQVREGSIERIYMAEIEGLLEESSGTLLHYLIHKEHHAVIGTAKNPEAKRALLSYYTEKVFSNSTEVAIALETGRYHQIRAQFSAIGHPIVGDVRYGSCSGDGKAIRLRCAHIRFKHPVSQSIITFPMEDRSATSK